MNYRHASTNDAASLAVIGSNVWIATYAPDGVPPEFARHVLAEFTEERVLARMADGARYWVAEEGARMVGFAEIVFGNRSACLKAEAQAEIVRLYVLEGCTRGGIGGRLLACCVDDAASQGVAWVWLSVYHRNHRAMAFYERMGWRRVGEIQFVLGGESYPNHVYACELTTNRDEPGQLLRGIPIPPTDKSP